MGTVDLIRSHSTKGHGRQHMVYMLMIYSDEADWAHQSPEEMLPTLQAHKALEDEIRSAGKFRGGGGLALTDSATTVRFRAGKPTVMDGPFAETKEQFGGFYLVEAESLDEALAYAHRIPGVENRAIEVRAVLYHSPV
jgi:hypothetical protein